jgi:DNA-binding response OmpR family regulator
MLEARQDDARLILDELRRAGFDPASERVETEADFLAHLDPDLELILADYHLPRFDTLRALRLVQERGLDVPVIVVTGPHGDEAVVECLGQGAADYVLKHRLARLEPAVALALQGVRPPRGQTKSKGSDQVSS